MQHNIAETIADIVEFLNLRYVWFLVNYWLTNLTSLWFAEKTETLKAVRFNMSRPLITRLICVALAGSVLTTIPVDTAQAARKTLLEQWFPKAANRLKNRRSPDVIVNERPAAAPVNKVSGPAYYTYKTEHLKALSLAGLLPVLAPVVEIIKVEEVVPVVQPAVPQKQGSQDTKKALEELDPASTGSTTRKIEKFKGIVTPAHQVTNAAVEGLSLKLEDGISSAIRKHYSTDPTYNWVDRDWKINANAEAVLAVLNSASEVGLDPADYQVEIPDLDNGNALEIEKRAAQFELALSSAVLRYGSDAENGRVNPNGISGYHDFPKYNRGYGKILSEIFASDNPDSTLDSLNPSNSRFMMLKAELAELRSTLDEDAIEPIKAGTFFKPGQEHAELPKVIALIKKKASIELRTKHSVSFLIYGDQTQFNKELVELVRDFQKEQGLGPDGIVGKNTIAKLQTASPAAKIEKVELAMERLRWLPRNFGQRHVFINQPAYQASYMVDDKAQLSMRAIVGKPSNQTYFFYDQIEIVELNPYWNVPYSILVNQKLGKIRDNPGYLTANGYEVVTARGVTDPYSVDWYSGAPKGVSIRQKPGNNNALGELKILFPNKHAIYMHDTPERNLFQRSSRAYSSGCIRLHDPRGMAAAVLQTSVDAVSREIATGQNKTLPVRNKIPVYVSYFTAWPNDDGDVGFYADIYGRDKALKKAIEKTRELRTQTSIVSS